MDITILIADDDRITRHTLRACIERAGMQVVEACDGRETLQMVREHDPRVLVLDIGMPQMNGYEVCRALRRSNTWRRIPIIMLTAENGLDAMRKGLVSGADAYITKPFQPDEVVREVRAMLHSI
ncbi:MAG: response regulator [Anaerolineales bacterium]|nr:response regulator [Anaerolineales bacterium]